MFVSLINMCRIFICRKTHKNVLIKHILNIHYVKYTCFINIQIVLLEINQYITHLVSDILNI